VDANDLAYLLLNKSATISRTGGMRKAPERGHALLVVADFAILNFKFFLKRVF
jgi:hypothetical protein